MFHPLVCARRVEMVRLPKLTAFVSDCLAIGMTLAALLASATISLGEDFPENVVLDFTATWCGPCQQMSPIVHKLQKQGYEIRKIDVDKQPNLAKTYGITSIPTFVLVVNGQEQSRANGVISEEQLRRMALQAGNAARNQPLASANPIHEGVSSPKSPRKATPDFDGDPAPRINLGPATPMVDSLAEKARGFPKMKFPFTKKEKPLAATPPEQAIYRGVPSDAEDVPAGHDPLAASVRIRVTDETGANFGSGTIIDSRVGRTTILTCGHLFKPQAGKPAPKSVDVDIFFPGGRHELYVGKLVDFDLEGDIGVITINTAGQLASTAIAPLTDIPAVQAQLTSIGCSGGDEPTKEPVRVTALNRYDGPDNIECTGLPAQGRSGGGLFDAHGQLVGVCIAADQEGQRGLYAGLKPIQALLTRAGFQQVLPPSAPAAKEPEVVVPNDQIRLAADTAADVPKTAAANSLLDKPFSQADLDWLDGRGAPSAGDISALFDDAPDAEVICIVRPKNGDAKRVVILNQASTRFVSYLLDSLDAPHAAPRTASLRVENPLDHSAQTSAAEDAVGVPKQAPTAASDRTTTRLTSQRTRFGSRSAE